MTNQVKPQQLVNELIAMSTNCQQDVGDENRTVFMGVNRNRVVSIGEYLYNYGGYQAMLAAWQAIPKHDQLELSHCWHGVGEWVV